MLPVEDLFVHCSVLVDDLIKDGRVQIPRRQGPAPGCTDAEIVTISLARHLLGRRSEAGFLAEIGREWPTLFPRMPHPSEVNRRTRWLYGALRADPPHAARPCRGRRRGTGRHLGTAGQTPSRVRGPDSWIGPNDLVARFGRDAAHGEWFYGFRLAIRTDLGSRLVRAWAIVPAALNERDLVPDLTAGAEHLAGLLNDNGFNGRAFTAYLAERGLPQPGPADQNPAHHHAQDPAKDHRGVAQPDRDHLRRAHRHHGPGPSRRAHLPRPAHPAPPPPSPPTA